MRVLPGHEPKGCQFLSDGVSDVNGQVSELYVSSHYWNQLDFVWAVWILFKGQGDGQHLESFGGVKPFDFTIYLVDPHWSPGRWALAVASMDQSGSLSDLHSGVGGQEHLEWSLPAVGTPVLPSQVPDEDEVPWFQAVEWSPVA